MKKSIEVADVVLERAKALANEEGTTVDALAEEGLRLLLGRRRSIPPFRLRDASVSGEGPSAAFRNAGWARVRDAAYAIEQ